MSRELSTRQKKFVQAKLEAKSNAQAARDDGYSNSVANVAGRKILSHPAVQAKLQQLMERAGIRMSVFHGRFRIKTLIEWHRSVVSHPICGGSFRASFSLLHLAKPTKLQKNLQPPQRREITMEETSTEVQEDFLAE